MPMPLLRLPASAERVRAVLGAVLGVLFAAGVSLWISPEPALWLIAPIGASAVLAGVVYNSLSGHRYPHRVVPGAMPDEGQGVRVSAHDLRTAMREYDEVLDIAPDELARLLRRAEGAAHDRLWGNLMCRDIMTPDPVPVDFKAPLAQAWRTMQHMQIKALPVVDMHRQVTGILTQGDLVRALGRVIRE